MKLVYLSPRDVLKARSDAIHIMASCRAFVPLGVDVELVTPDYHRVENMPRRKAFDNYGIAEEERFSLSILPTRLRDSSPPSLVRAKKGVFFGLHALRRLLLEREHKRYRHYIVFAKCYTAVVPYLLLRRTVSGMRNIVIVFEAAAFLGKRHEARVISRCEHLVAINPFVRDDIVAGIDYPEQRILVPPLGCDDAFTDSLAVSRQEARQALGLDSGKFLAVYSGKIAIGEASEIALLLDAAARVPQATFVFTGGKQEAIEYFVAKARTMGLGNVRFTGFFDSNREPLLYMRAANVLLSFYPPTDKIPTLRYMVPNKIMQYARSRTVIIAAQYPAIEYILGTEGAIYVPPGDTAALARRIADVMDGRVAAEAIATRAHRNVAHQTYSERARGILKHIVPAGEFGK